MAGLENLLNSKLLRRDWWVSVLNGHAAQDIDGARKFSYEELRRLYDVLDRCPAVTEGNRAVVVETIRALAEFMIWGDQHEPGIFDFFAENNIMVYMHKLLLQQQNRTGDVAKQVLQTLSIIVQNVRSERGVLFVFANNHINNVVEAAFDFDDEEVLGFYITFLKAISLRLDSTTAPFFITTPDDGDAAVGKPPRLPLYSQALRLAHHREGMVRAGVRTLTLSVYSVRLPAVEAVVASPPSSAYFTEVAAYISRLVGVLGGELLDALAAFSGQSLSAMDSQLAEVEDMLSYCGDVLSSAAPAVRHMMVDALWQWLLVPNLLRPLAVAADGPPATYEDLTSQAMVMYTLERALLLLGYTPLVNNIVIALLGLAPVTSEEASPTAPPARPSCRQALIAMLAAGHPITCTMAMRLLTAAYRCKALSSDVRVALGLAGLDDTGGTVGPSSGQGPAPVLDHPALAACVCAVRHDKPAPGTPPGSSPSTPIKAGRQHAAEPFAYLPCWDPPIRRGLAASSTASSRLGEPSLWSVASQLGSLQALGQLGTQTGAASADEEADLQRHVPAHVQDAVEQVLEELVEEAVVAAVAAKPQGPHRGQDSLQSSLLQGVGEEAKPRPQAAAMHPASNGWQGQDDIVPASSPAALPPACPACAAHIKGPPTSVGCDVLGAVLSLLGLPRMPPHTLWLAGHFAARCAVQGPGAAPGRPAPNLSPEQRQQVVEAVTAAASSVSDEFEHGWVDAFFPVLAAEWDVTAAGFAMPQLSANADQLATGVYVQLADEEALGALGLARGVQDALALVLCVQRLAALLRACQALGLVREGGPPSLAWLVTEMSKAWTDVVEGQQVVMSKANSVACQVCFNPPDPIRVNIVVAGDPAGLALSSDRPLRGKAALTHCSPSVVLAQTAHNCIDAGVVVSTAPLLGSSFYPDPKVGVWLHCKVRPSVVTLLKQVKKAAARRGGLVLCLRSLSDGHWILQFHEEKRVTAALGLIGRVSATAGGVYQELVAHYVTGWLDAVMAST